MAEPDRAALAVLDPHGDFPRRLVADRRRLARLGSGLWSVSPASRQRRLAAIEALAHRLAGAAGTFGFDAVGDAALGLEELLIEQRQGLLSGEGDLVASRLAALRLALAAILP